jgi:hypothetical protein
LQTAGGDEKGTLVSSSPPLFAVLGTPSEPSWETDKPADLEFLLENFAALTADEHALRRELAAKHRPKQYGDEKREPSTDETIKKTLQVAVDPDEREGVDGSGHETTRLPDGEDELMWNSHLVFEPLRRPPSDEETTRADFSRRTMTEEEEKKEHSKFDALSTVLSAEFPTETNNRLLATVTVLTQDLLTAYISAAVGDIISLAPSNTAYSGTSCTGVADSRPTSLCMTKAVSFFCAIVTASGSCTFDGLNTGTNGRRVVIVETGTSTPTAFQQITFTRGYVVREREISCGRSLLVR